MEKLRIDVTTPEIHFYNDTTKNSFPVTLQVLRGDYIYETYVTNSIEEIKELIDSAKYLRNFNHFQLLNYRICDTDLRKLMKDSQYHKRRLLKKY